MRELAIPCESTCHSVFLEGSIEYVCLYVAWQFRLLLRAAKDKAARLDASEDVKSLNKKIQQKGLAIYVGYLVTLLSVLYVCATVVMAHRCEQALWGVRGCIRLLQ